MSQLVSPRNLIGSSLDRVRSSLRNRRRQKEFSRWVQAGKPAPPPHLAKQAVLREYAKRYQTRVFIETGTFMGDMIEAMRNTFDTIYSIELSPVYFEKAQQRFQEFSNIQLLQGDSGKVLGEILQHIDEPALLWLDGHYSAGSTARGEKDTPVFEELSHVIDVLEQQPGHVVLIDDARCFGTDPAYPLIEELSEYLKRHDTQFDLDVEEDIIRITSLTPTKELEVA